MIDLNVIVLIVIVVNAIDWSLICLESSVHSDFMHEIKMIRNPNLGRRIALSRRSWAV